MHDRYRVVTEPPWSPPNFPAEDLEGLAAALNALASPGNALSDLTADMVELAFNSLRPRDRQKLLGRLGIPMAAPRRVSRTLCRDVLARLRREAEQHSCTCGLRELTVTVMNQVGGYVLGQGAEKVPDPVSRWGATLVRATVFAWCNASVTDARILAWAADQDWFGTADDEEETARLAAVGAEARTVVAAHQDSIPDRPERGEDEEKPPVTGEQRGRPTDTDRSGTTSPAAEPTAASGSTPERMAEAFDDVRISQEMDPDTACQQLESAFAVARQAVETVSDAIADGRPPKDADIASLAGLRTAFDNVEAVLRAVGIEVRSRRVEDLAHAARTYRAEQERDVLARETLRQLLDVAPRPGSTATAATAAEAVRVAVGRLLDTPVWGEPEREESTALASLVRLISLGGQADAAAEILALQTQVVRVLPTCGMAALTAAELTFTQPEEGDREPSGSGNALDDGDEQQAREDVALSRRSADEPPTRQLSGTQAAQSSEQVHNADELPVHPAVDEPELLALSDTANPASAQPVIGPIEDMPVHVPAPTGQDDSDEALVERALARLVAERRFGLAHHLAKAAAHPETQVSALRLAGAAALLASGDSQSARLTADLLQQYGGYVGQDTEGSDLLLLPALLRIALITGDHSAGAQLKTLVPRLPDRLGEAAAAVADRALSGALMIASPLIGDAS